MSGYNTEMAKLHVETDGIGVETGCSIKTPQKRRDCLKGSKELSLSQILPESYKDSKIISLLIENLISLGLSQEKLNALMGVNKTPEMLQVFSLLSKQIQLHNWQQFYFVITYASKTYSTDIRALLKTIQIKKSILIFWYLNKYA
jgi:hypothetical protein